MILRFPIVIVGLFLFVLPACQEKSDPVLSLSEIDNLKPGGPPVHQPLDEEADSSGTQAVIKEPKPAQTEAGDTAAAVPTPTGGDTSGGSAAVVPTPTGGDTSGGSAAVVPTPTGGDTSGGSAAVVPTPTGGDTSGGSAAVVPTPTGGDTSGGSAAVVPTPTGGDTSGGSAAAAVPTPTRDDVSRDAPDAPAFIPGDSKGDIFDTPPPPMELKFTIKQFVDSGLLGEGGSDIYHSYMTMVLNGIHNSLIQSKSAEDIAGLSSLCDGDIPRCRKEGLSLDRLDKKKIMNLIYFAGHSQINVYEIGQGEMALVLQGGQITQESTQELMENIEKGGYVIKKALINLSQDWADMKWFFYFASQVKEKQMDLHIVGKCSFLCANHLIPAANKVVMEYYGYIGYVGNMSSVAQDVKKAYPPRLDQLINQFSQDYFSQGVVNGLVKLFAEHVENPKSISIYNESPVRGALEQANRTLSPQPAFSFWGLSPEHQRIVLTQVTQEIRNALMTFFFNISESVQNSAGYHSYNQQIVKEEVDHYEEFQIIPESSKDYSYLDFVTLTGRLVRNIPYMVAFPSSLRSYYSEPEQKKPYVIVFPSADILRALGIPIEGKNPTEVLRTFSEDSEDSKDRFLFLSLEDMENCDFFADSASFTTNTLQECLSEDGSL